MPDSPLASEYIAAGGMGGAQTPRTITIHATCPSSLLRVDPYQTCRPGMARSTARFFSGITYASAHYTVDVAGIVQSVPETRKAWHDGHNTNSVGIEICGQAAWTREQWLRSDIRPVLDRTTRLIADIAGRWGIPMRWQTDAEIRSGAPGIRTHADISRVLRVSDHTDPGPGFPRDLLLTTTPPSPQEDDMAFAPVDVWNGVKWGGESAGDRLGKAALAFDKAAALEKKIDELTVKVADLAKRPAVGGSINTDALVKAIADELAKRMQS